MGKAKSMKKIVVLLATILFFITIQSTALAVDCDWCWEMRDGLEVMGYSRSEIKEWSHGNGCDECFSWAKSGSSGSSSSDSGDCCGATALILLSLCGVFIVYYGKKHEMKK